MIDLSDDEISIEFSAVWGLLDDGALESISLEPSVTLRPEQIVLTPVERSLPRLVTRGSGQDHVELIQLLGKGGMGEVHLARQGAADRDVAVKVLRPDTKGPGASRALLREGLIHARLEHPNIVPVHMVGADADGDTVIVMKKVDGTAWIDLLKDASHPAHPEDDRLAGHLGILMQVCRAAHFAHSRGIVHRDIKPHNVMIGEFGEVYVLDWGLALPISDAAAAGLPTLESATTISGTPAYMAPEMLEPAPWRVDARTDVYQLGAVLHHILTGHPRHRGETVKEMLQRVYDSVPVEFSPDVPAELAAICNRATHAAKSQRHPSADALRRAIAEFLEHRASSRLEAAAFARLSELEAGLSRPGFERDEAAMYTAAEEARFAFRAALAAWPDNTEARLGLDATLVTMIGWALESGNLQAARLLYGELDEKDQRLAERIERHVQARESRIEELQTLRQRAAGFDPADSRQARGRLAVGLGALWLLVPGTVYYLDAVGRIEYSYTVSALSQGFAWLITVAVLVIFRATLFVGKVNRRLMVALLTMIPAMTLLIWVGEMVGVTALQSLPIRTMALAGACAVMGVAIDIRMLGAAAAYLFASLCSVLRPDLALLLQALGNLAALVSVGLAWTVGRRPGEGDAPNDLLTATAKLPRIADPEEVDR